MKMKILCVALLIAMGFGSYDYIKMRSAQKENRILWEMCWEKQLNLERSQETLLVAIKASYTIWMEALNDRSFNQMGIDGEQTDDIWTLRSDIYKILNELVAAINESFMLVYTNMVDLKERMDKIDSLSESKGGKK